MLIVNGFKFIFILYIVSFNAKVNKHKIIYFLNKIYTKYMKIQKTKNF